MSQPIVVDTSVARACGKGNLTSNSPAPECIRALVAISEGALSTAMSKALKDEWKEHAGEYAKRWLSNMIARKRFVSNNAEWVGEPEFEAAASDLPPKEHREVLKDSHLVSLAMCTGRRVLSLDEAQRLLLKRVAVRVRTLCQLHWANPTRDRVENWLRDGAPDDRSLCIPEGCS